MPVSSLCITIYLRRARGVCASNCASEITVPFRIKHLAGLPRPLLVGGVGTGERVDRAPGRPRGGCEPCGLEIEIGKFQNVATRDRQTDAAKNAYSLCFPAEILRRIRAFASQLVDLGGRRLQRALGVGEKLVEIAPDVVEPVVECVLQPQAFGAADLANPTVLQNGKNTTQRR